MHKLETCMCEQQGPAPWGLLELTVRQAPKKSADLPADFNASLPSGKRLISFTAQSTASATPAQHCLSSPYPVALQDCEMMHAWSAGRCVKQKSLLGQGHSRWPLYALFGQYSLESAMVCCLALKITYLRPPLVSTWPATCAPRLHPQAPSRKHHFLPIC